MEARLNLQSLFENIRTSKSEVRGPETAVSRVTALSKYVYDRFYLPIARTGCVPAEGLDFGKITYEDLEELSKALESLAQEYYQIDAAIRASAPLPTHNPVFI